MKPLCLLASLAFLCSLSSHAQDLTVNSIPNNKRSLPIDGVLAGPKQKMPHKKQRKWKKEHDRIDGHIDHALLKTMAQTTATIVTLLNDSCFSVIPFIPNWHGEFISDKRSQAARISLTTAAAQPMWRVMHRSGSCPTTSPFFFGIHCM
jgi:hypothetical protein